MTEKKVYSDEEIGDAMKLLKALGDTTTLAILQQLMDERDAAYAAIVEVMKEFHAVLKDLKELETEVQDAINHSVDSNQWFELVDWERSNKWKNIGNS